VSRFPYWSSAATVNEKAIPAVALPGPAMLR